MLKMKKLVSKQKDETFVIDKGSVGNVEVRHRIDGAMQETFASAVAQAVLNQDGYFPLRKEPMMLYLFALCFVVDGEKILLTDEAGEVDLYETYYILEEQLHLMSEARSKSENVNAILSHIEAAVDLLVFREKDKMDATISSGLASKVGKTLLHVDSMTFDLAMVAGEIRKLVMEKEKELGPLLTKANMKRLMDTMEGLQAALAGKHAVGD